MSSCAPGPTRPPGDEELAGAVDALLRFVRAFGLVERDVVCCGEVTVAQCVCLQALSEGPLEVAELADVVGTSRPAVTRMVDTLVRKGWADRERDQTDRRRVRVTLTQAGTAQASDLHNRTELVVAGLLERVARDKREMVVEAIQELARAAAGQGSCC